MNILFLVPNVCTVTSSHWLHDNFLQVSYLANVVRLGQTPESSFNQWAWDLVLRLKLHANERSPQDAWCPLPSSSAPSVPEITDSPTMHPVFKAVKAGIPIGCFLAIDMTTIGHRFGRNIITLVSNR